MLTLLIMAVIIAFLGSFLIYRDKKGKQASFFDLDTSGAMRGFWCLVVVLVHIPEMYQNPLQDAVGSFAYIGVSFFFLTSSYGLTLSALKDPEGFTKGFWKRRLSRLLLPMLCVNILTILAELIFTRSFEPLTLLRINGWVRDLLAFYFIMWAMHRFLPKSFSAKKKSLLVLIPVFIFSVCIYVFNGMYIFGWPTEIYGCIYGVLLALYKDKFLEFTKRKWFLKSAMFFAASVILGLLYLKLKGIPFLGDYIIKIVLGIAILGLIFVLNSKISLGNPVSRFLGGISYEVYLVHSVAFIILQSLPITLDSGVFILGAIILTILFATGINLCCGALLKKRK